MHGDLKDNQAKLDSGSLAEHGTHEELSEISDGKYADLWRIQRSLESIGRGEQTQ